MGKAGREVDRLRRSYRIAYSTCSMGVRQRPMVERTNKTNWMPHHNSREPSLKTIVA